VHAPRLGDDDGAPAATPADVAHAGGGGEESARRRLGRSAVGRPIRERLRARRARRPRALADEFAAAFRERDLEALRGLAAPGIELLFRGSDGDVHATGEEALRSLAGISEVAFGGRFLSESWSVSEGDSVDTFFGGVRHGGSRVDLWWALVVRNGRITGIGLLSAGPLAGREAREWAPGPAADADG
jgi:hypothetical protein